MNQPNLLDNTEIQIVKVSQGAGTSAVDSDTVDMQNFSGVLFVTSLGTANAGNFVHAATSSNDSNWNDLEGTKQTPGTNGDQVLLDIYKPRERYIRLEATRGVSTTLETVIAIKYGPRKAPITTVATQETHLSPAEGTA